MFRTLLFVCLAAHAVYCKHEIYDGFALFEVIVENEEQIQILHNLEEKMSLDIWAHALPSRPGTILVSKDKKSEFADTLFAAGIQYIIESDNIKEQLELEDEIFEQASRRSASANRSRIGLNFDTIHRYEVVDQYLVDLASAFPNVVTVVYGGRSFEGRDIKYIRISTTNFQDTSKPVVFLQSLLHAREWVTLPASLYAIKKLVLEVTEQDLVSDIDWVILPIANPDGYEWTQTNARFWRKNRATGLFINDICMGVDLNRNYDVHWSTASSSSVCSDTFHGLRPLSESETQVSTNIMREHSQRLAMFIDIHSFGSMILYGYGSGVLAPNALLTHAAGVQMAQAIDRVKWATNRNYVVGNIANVILYTASGGASDYAQVSGPASRISYTFELPSYRNSNGINGFLVDPDFIEQAGYETWEGIKAGARYALNLWRQNSSS